MIRATRDYENCLLHPENSEALQAALARMDDLKAWDFEARIKEILFKLNIGQAGQADHGLLTAATDV